MTTTELAEAVRRLGLPDGLSETVIREQIQRDRREREWVAFVQSRAQAREPKPRPATPDPPVKWTPPGVIHDAVKALRTLGMLKDRAEGRVAAALRAGVYADVGELILAAMRDGR
jgi:hypothetical protein